MPRFDCSVHSVTRSPHAADSSSVMIHSFKVESFYGTSLAGRCCAESDWRTSSPLDWTPLGWWSCADATSWCCPFTRSTPPRSLRLWPLWRRRMNLGWSCPTCCCRKTGSPFERVWGSLMRSSHSTTGWPKKSGSRATSARWPRRQRRGSRDCLDFC